AVQGSCLSDSRRSGPSSALRAPSPRWRRFAFLGTLGKKSGLHTFWEIRQFSDALFPRPSLDPQNGMEAMRMIAHLDPSEDAVSAFFAAAPWITESPPSRAGSSTLDIPIQSPHASRLFAAPPWTTKSPEWLAIDAELPLDHPVRLIARLIDEDLNLQALVKTYAGRGTKAHRPDLLVQLLVYEHSQGRPRPVQWRKDLLENKAVQWLVFGLLPSQTTLYEFRDRVQPILLELNRQIIRTAIDEGHTDASRGALDGTTVAANATRHRMVNLDTVEKRLDILEREI